MEWQCLGQSRQALTSPHLYGSLNSNVRCTTRIGWACEMRSALIPSTPAVLPFFSLHNTLLYKFHTDNIIPEIVTAVGLQCISNLWVNSANSNSCWLDMGVAEFKSARRWKKNLTRRRAKVQVSRIWFFQVKWLEIFASRKFWLVGNYFRQLKTTRRLEIA